MNCIGHDFMNNQDALLTTKAFLDKVDSPKVLATIDDVILHKVEVEFRNHRVIDRKVLMRMRNKDWIEYISNNTVTLYLNDKIQIENIIIEFKAAMRKYNTMVFQEKIKAVYYKDLHLEEKSYDINPENLEGFYPRTNEDYKGLILDYELSV